MADWLAESEERNQCLLALMNQFGDIGLTEQGGISRLAASREDGVARDALCAWLTENGIDVRIDPIGNIFGVVEFTGASTERAFYCGSHLDSQPEAGKFDGVLGVAAACSAALALRDAANQGQFEPAYRYFIIACWTSEEGARFQPSLIGSSVFTGQLLTEKAWALTDSDSIRLGDALYSIGYRGSDEVPEPDHYLELHIEQDTRLEQAQLPIAVVSGSWGAHKYHVQITGKPDHTGPTPMEERVDALLASAYIVVSVNQIATNAESTVYSSVGKITVHPNSPNTIADKVQLWIEFRSAEQSALLAAHEALRGALLNVSKSTGCTTKILSTTTRPAVTFDEKSRLRVTQVFEEAGIGSLNLSTVAGHDALNLQQCCPATLLFVPSKDGITHSPQEFTSPGEITRGFEAMMHALAELMSSDRTHADNAESLKESLCN